MIDKTSLMLSLIAVYPEILLLVMACVVALVDLTVKSRLRTGTYILAVLTTIAAALLTGIYALGGQTWFAFEGLVVSDPMGNWLKCFAAIAMCVTFIYGRPYAGDRDMLRGGELFSIGLLALLGIFVMISGHHFLVIYLGLELLTLSSYALVALRRDSAIAIEAAMKYFVLGAMASGFLLYGMSMIYGATGSLNVNEVFLAIQSGQIRHQVLVFGVVFIVAGLAFKFGVVPFHMWIPDVYQGAPTAVALMVGGAPKLAAFAMAIRILVEGLLPLSFDWQQMLILLAVASLLLGNLAAIAQTNMKRMLAYSTISQMGFVMLALASGVFAGNASLAPSAYGSAMFYMVTYVLTTLASFGIIMLLAREGFEHEQISDFAGLNQRSPLYAGVMTVCMLSLAGLPPLVGFQAKLVVIQSLLQSGVPFYLGLAVFAVLMSLIGAFYYIRVIKVMYFDQSVDTTQPVRAGFDVRAVLTVNGLLVLALGIFPGSLLALCLNAVHSLFK